MTLVVPTAIVWRDRTPLMTMGRVEPGKLSFPFWADTLASAHTIGFRPLDTILDDPDHGGVSGMIFHVGRCGSTLVCRQFDALPRTFAISEPFVFQQLLDGPAAPADLTQRRIRGLLSAHWQGLRGSFDRLVIKWPALLSQHARVLCDALPGVPALFLHRDPREVLVSVAVDPVEANGIVALRHLEKSSVPAIAEMPTDPLEISARLIAAAYAGAAEATAMRRLDYADLPDATWRSVAPYFGFDLSDSDREAMQAAARYYSKAVDGKQIFTPDREAKAAVRNERLDALVDRIIAPATAGARARIPLLERDGMMSI